MDSLWKDKWSVTIHSLAEKQNVAESISCEALVIRYSQKAAKVISLLEEQEFICKTISLTGGKEQFKPDSETIVNEGCKAYSATYDSVSEFNAQCVNDYLAAYEQMKKLYGDALTCFSFECICMKFEKEGRNLNLTLSSKGLLLESGRQNETVITEIVTLLTDALYGTDSIVEGLKEFSSSQGEEEDLEYALISFFSVNSIEELELYCICAHAQNIPLFLDNNTVLLYTERSQAEKSATNIAKNFAENKIQAIKIRDVCQFFAMVSAANSMNRFLLNGQGKPTRFSELCSRDTAEKAVSKEDVLKFQIEAQAEQPKRNPQLIAIRQKELFGSENKKGKDYYCGLFSLLCGLVSIVFFIMIGVFDKFSGWYCLSLIAGLVLGIISKIESSKKMEDEKMTAKIGIVICTIPLVLIFFSILSEIS